MVMIIVYRVRGECMKKEIIFLCCLMVVPTLRAEGDVNSTFMCVAQPIQTTMNIVQNGLWIAILFHLYCYVAEKERLAQAEEYIMPVFDEEQDQEDEHD